MTDYVVSPNTLNYIWNKIFSLNMWRGRALVTWFAFVERELLIKKQREWMDQVDMQETDQNGILLIIPQDFILPSVLNN